MPQRVASALFGHIHLNVEILGTLHWWKSPWKVRVKCVNIGPAWGSVLLIDDCCRRGWLNAAARFPLSILPWCTKWSFSWFCALHTQYLCKVRNWKSSSTHVLSHICWFPSLCSQISLIVSVSLCTEYSSYSSWYNNVLNQTCMSGLKKWD